MTVAKVMQLFEGTVLGAKCISNQDCVAPFRAMLQCVLSILSVGGVMVQLIVVHCQVELAAHVARLRNHIHPHITSADYSCGPARTFADLYCAIPYPMRTRGERGDYLPHADTG